MSKMTEFDITPEGKTKPFGDQIPYGDPHWYQNQNTPYHNESHLKFRRTMRDFVEEHCAPNVDDWDKVKGEERPIPAEIYTKAFSSGWLPGVVGVPWPEEHVGPFMGGAAKFDTFHEQILIDELCRTGSGGFVWGIMEGLAIGLPPVLQHGSKYLKDKVAGPCLRGEKMICLAISEPYAGSDTASIQTTAVKTPDGKHYIVNGEKKWITNGIWADYFTVAVRTGGPGAKGISFLLIEREMSGITTKRMPCMGMLSSGTTFVEFDDVKVPVENLIGEENGGFKYMMHNFNHERWAFVVQESIRWACKRKTFGQSLINHQVINHKIVEMAARVESTQAALDLLTYQMSVMTVEEAQTTLGGPTANLKAHSTKVFDHCAREAAQVFGGSSYVRGGQGVKVERLYREVRAMAIPGGSEEIMTDLAAKQALRAYPKVVKFLPGTHAIGANGATERFGEQIPYGDPSWYQGFKSPYPITESHMLARTQMREFIETEIMDNVQQWELNMEVPRSAHHSAFDNGWLPGAAGAPWPDEYAGGKPSPEGFDIFHELVTMDEMSRCASGGFVWGIAGGLSIGLPPVLLFGSKYLKDKVAADCLSGRKMICLAITEPMGGSDVANIQTTAEKTPDGKHYIVNGEKKWITNGIWADYFTVAVRTGGEGAGGVSMMLIERDFGGVETTRIDCMGVKSSGTTYVEFDDVKVPVENLIGAENGGFLQIMYNFNHERWGLIVISVRFARCCLEEAIKYAMRRETFGKRLIDHQVIAHKIANMANRVEACQAMLEQLTYQMKTMPHDQAMVTLAGHTAMLKCESTRTFEMCAREAAQIFGGASYVKNGAGEKVERLYREVRAMAIPGGSEEIMQDLAGKFLAGSAKAALRAAL